MMNNVVEKLGEDAYFIVDLMGFQNTIAPFDTRVANQTILFGGDVFVSALEEPPVEAEKKN